VHERRSQVEYVQDKLRDVVGPQICAILEDLAEEGVTRVAVDTKAADGWRAERKVRILAYDDEGDVVYAQTVRLTNSPNARKRSRRYVAPAAEAAVEDVNPDGPHPEVLRDTGPQLLKEKEAARYLGVSCQFLRKSRMDGTRSGHTEAPPYIKGVRMIR
jgi:hypothetical protein